MPSRSTERGRRLERANKRRYEVHQQIAAACREPVPDEDATEAEKELTPERRAEARDPMPNWAVAVSFLEDNLEEICMMARAKKRQRTRK